MVKLIDDYTLEKLIDKDKFIVIAVSTGIDSMSLFHFLYKKGYKIVVAHVNHKKRVESDNEYLYLENLCKTISVPFNGYVMPEIKKGNFQEEARKLRYEFFKKVAKEYETDQIVVAHQKDDKVETILMRLIRGTALRGYSGIKEISYTDNYKIIRPLLNTTRETIKKYQKENNIKYFEDSSNSENHYTRNIIRHKLVPIIEDINEGFYSSFDNYSEDVYLMYKLTDRLALEFIDSSGDKKDSFISYKISDFLKLDEIVKRQVILRTVNILSNNTLELSHERIKEILSFDMSLKESKVLEIGSNISLSIEYGTLTFYKKEEAKKIDLSLDNIGEYIIDSKSKIILSQNYHLLPKNISYLLCYNNTENIFPIRVRNVMMGDRITVNGISKKIYDLLKEHKIPKRLREKTLVFYNDNGIFFVPGIIRKETDTKKENKLYITYLGETYEN